MQLSCIMIKDKYPEKILKKTKLKVTVGRVQILKILKEAKYPIDVAHINAGLKISKVEIDQVTVYRILDKFIENKLIEKTEFQEGKYRYELISTSHHHHHAVCVKCGRVNDINQCKMGSIKNTLIKNQRFEVQSHRLDFFGLCEKCQ